MILSINAGAQKWFDLQGDEVPAVALASLTLFFLSGASVLFNNYAETAFLKRYGIDYLPTVTVVNALVTFVVMGYLGSFLARVPGNRLLRNALVLFAVSAGVVRLAVPLGQDTVYPLLYIMKTQFELLLLFLFWNLANELFSTFQAKRIFPLMTAGGILGGVAGSFSTPAFASLGSPDNLLWVYGAISLFAGALANKLCPHGGVTRPVIEKRKKRRGIPLATELRNGARVLQSSSLARLLVLLTLVPNIVVPILNYQFSFAIDTSYGSESGLLAFYSTFRGIQNIIALLIALFAGRFYRRFGIPTSLLFHPANYAFVFAAFLFRFDLLSAVYAGVTVGVLRRAVHNPARKALFGLFPRHERALLLPFLRGAVVRAGTLIGALLVLICQSGYFAICRAALHPQNLSAFGLAFAGIWVWGTLRLRRNYPEILLGMLGVPSGSSNNDRATVRSIQISPEDARALKQSLRDAWRYVSAAVALHRENHWDPKTDLRQLHLVAAAENEARQMLGELAARDRSGVMGTVHQAYESGDQRNRANALETLGHVVGHPLRSLVALLEDADATRRMSLLPGRFDMFRRLQEDLETSAELLLKTACAKGSIRISPPGSVGPCSRMSA